MSEKKKGFPALSEIDGASRRLYFALADHAVRAGLTDDEQQGCYDALRVVDNAINETARRLHAGHSISAPDGRDA